VAKKGAPMSLVAPLILCLSLTPGLAQTRPDFSGTWTKIPAAAGETAAILTITQTKDTLTVDDAGRRSVYKLDPSGGKRVTTDGSAAGLPVQGATSSWEGDTLVLVFPIQSSQDGPYILRVAMLLDGKTLVVHAISSRTTGVVFAKDTKRYSK
jgi:hypothetical protein